MTLDYEQPPDRLTWYYVPWMLQAEAGTLRFDQTQWRIHGVPNNVVVAIWKGMLIHGSDGPVLTDLGQRLLNEWKASPEGQRCLARQQECDHCDNWSDQCVCGQVADNPVQPVQPVQLEIVIA